MWNRNVYVIYIIESYSIKEFSFENRSEKFVVVSVLLCEFEDCLFDRITHYSIVKFVNDFQMIETLADALSRCRYQQFNIHVCTQFFWNEVLFLNCVVRFQQGYTYFCYWQFGCTPTAWSQVKGCSRNLKYLRCDTWKLRGDWFSHRKQSARCVRIVILEDNQLFEPVMGKKTQGPSNSIEFYFCRMYLWSVLRIRIACNQERDTERPSLV